MLLFIDDIKDARFARCYCQPIDVGLGNSIILIDVLTSKRNFASNAESNVITLQGFWRAKDKFIGAMPDNGT